MKMLLRHGATLLSLLLLTVSCSKGEDTGEDTDSAAEEDTSAVDLTCEGLDRFDADRCEDRAGASSCIVHVNKGVEKSGDGSTWQTAFKSIQEGIDAARCGVLTADICPSWQVWVAYGNYHIHRNCATDTVRLRSRVEVYGGFQAGMEALSQRNPEKYPTTLLGTNESDDTKRVYHVVTANEDAVLDGFTIMQGNANHSSNVEHQQGGGVYIDGSNVVIARCRFRDNYARNSGAAIIVDSGTLIVSQSDFQNNRVHGDGAGIASWESHVRVSDSYFEQNHGCLGSGGIFAHSDTLEITNTVFEKNRSNFGPSAVQLQLGTVVVDNAEFLGNESHPFLVFGNEMSSDESFDDQCAALSANEAQATAPKTIGGTLYCVRGTLKMSQSKFEDNESAGDKGGGLLSSRCEVAISDTSFFNNRCAGKGGGAYFSQSPGTVTRCSFLSNEAYQGGGVFLGFTDTILTSAVLVNNTATVGGAASIHSEWPTIINATISGNTAKSVGGGINYMNGAGHVENSIFWDNGPEDISYWDFENPPYIAWSLLESAHGEGNIVADPLFVDEENGDFHLQSTSPCIDRANGDVAPEYDVEGNSRHDHPAIENQGDGEMDFADLGAFEYVP